jgi:biopolymer transport protein ExbD
MRYRKAITDSEEISDINVSPLIDMVFILLIFFIVTTVFVEETGTDVDKPQAASAVNLEKNSILLAITSKGQIVYGGKEVGIGGVRPLVRRLTQQEPMPVIIQVDKSAHAGLLVRVIDESKLGGAKNVSIAAEQGGG